MKKNVLKIMGIAFLAFIVLISATQIKDDNTERKVLNPLDSVTGFISCPNSPTTIQGCIAEVDGCFFVNTINGRTIAVGIFGRPVGVGDEVSLTGNWVTDADCAPCLLNATSVTDLGSCD